MRALRLILAMALAYAMPSFAQGLEHTLFSSEPDSVIYRIPAIACASTGDLIAIADNRYDHGYDVGNAKPIDILFRISPDDGHSWSGTRMIADCHNMDYASSIYGFGDACIVADRTSDRQMVICVGDSTGRTVANNGMQRVYRFYGSDGGRKWSRGENISDMIYSLVPGLDCIFIASGKIHQSRYVRKGEYYRLYCSMLTLGYGNAVIYSDDFGETWSLLGTALSCCPKGDEAKVDELPDGSVIISSRTKGRWFNIFRFDDSTFTSGSWSLPQLASGIRTIDNECNGEILSLEARDARTGRMVWLFLQSVPYGPKRSHVSIYFKSYPVDYDFSSVTPESFGEGWSRFEVTDRPSSYSTFCQMADGRIGFLYERGGKGEFSDIVFDSFGIDEITGGLYR